MNAFVIKILAVGLTVSQIFTRPPEQIQTQFDPQADQAQVSQILQQGCQYVGKEFGTDNIDLEDVLQLVVANAKALKAKADKAQKEGATAQSKNFAMKLVDQLDFDAILHAYKQFCKNEQVENSAIKLNEVIEYYNTAMKDLPDPSKLKGLHLPEASLILDRDGNRFTELYADNGRRNFVALKDLPPYIKQAFVAAEDQHFYEHHGVDIRGIVRAFHSSMSGKGRPQGGSTITQQVVKNLLVGDDLTFERKMREMVLAARVEKILSKDEILELYLNYVFLGRASWGIEMASKSYFGKPARDLTQAEAAFIAGLTKGPNYYHPDKYPDRAKERWNYVLGRMKEDSYISDEDYSAAIKQEVKTVAFESPSKRAAYYFLDEIQRDAKRKIPGLTSLTAGSFVVRSTIHPDLQRTAEEALQDGLAEYERASGRSVFSGPVGSLADDIEKYDSDWQHQIAIAHSRLYDVRWPLAVVLGRTMQTREGKVFTTKDTKVGLVDGRNATLIAPPSVLKSLKVYDLVHVKVNETKTGITATLMNPPQIQGGVIVMEANSGRILALSGGFSYADSQLDRVTQAIRQPGSTLKPFIYLSALNLGYQPNTLIPDAPFTLPKLERGGQDWSPHNYDGGSRGLVTIRQAVEQSLNLPTGRIMKTMACTRTAPGRCEDDPLAGLDYISRITHELGIYDNPIRYYPFVLGAQPTRLIDMAAAYASIANISVPPSKECPTCMRPVPHFIESLEQNGEIKYKRKRFGEEDSMIKLPSLDRVAIYQIRRILEGTLARGTAVAIKDLAGYVAGKTGTSNNFTDAWFMGFTNDLVVGVWVGYDNSDGKRRILGKGFTGGRVALPIAAKIIRRSFEVYHAKEPLSPIPPDIANQVVEYPIDVRSGEFNGGNFMEVFRIAPNRGPVNTRNSILRGNELGMSLSYPAGEEGNPDDVEYLSEQEDQAPDVIPNEPGYRSMQPGAEDMSEIWRRNNRAVDPQFSQPPFFRQ